MHKMLFFLFCFFTLSGFSDVEELKKELEKVLIENHIPGMSLAIVDKEGPVIMTGIGYADVEKKVLADEKTRFRIGSISKTFTALSVLKLVDEKKLSLEDSVKQLVPEVYFENKWEDVEPIRIVHLLEHTTGWDDMHFRELAKSDPTIGLKEALDYDHSSRVSRWKPATRMSYSNSGVGVAAYIVEKISGKKFEEYVQENFFNPIGMETAIFFYPSDGNITKEYNLDGKKTFSYWNELYRSAGAINASAKDMAAYLHFYLQRGSVNNKELLKKELIDRMEIPTTTWAAKEGLKVGYGLNNFVSLDDGFVYHGHTGGLQGSLAEFFYLKEFGVGYFFAINTGNEKAFNQIDKVVRAYITKNLERPTVPKVAGLSAEAKMYAGWYEYNSPRNEWVAFLERLMLVHLFFREGKLYVDDREFFPVNEREFRQAKDPIASLILIQEKEGKFVQLGGFTTIKKMSTWLAIAQMALTIFCLLALASSIIYAPFWLFKKRRALFLVLPFITALLPIVAYGILIFVAEDGVFLLGNLTFWSFSLFLITILFPLGTAASLLALIFASNEEKTKGYYFYSIVVVAALFIISLYLAYWKVIGFRTWS